MNTAWMRARVHDPRAPWPSARDACGKQVGEEPPPLRVVPDVRAQRSMLFVGAPHLGSEEEWRGVMCD